VPPNAPPAEWPGLVAAAALLLDELGQGSGVPEMGRLSRDGRIRRLYRSRRWPSIETWAGSHGIKVWSSP
jgi:hypothetical protein